MEFLPLIIDLAFVALLVINVLEGRKKGFVKMILSFAATVLSWLIAAELSQPLAQWANEAFVHGMISGSIEKAIADSLGGGTNSLIEAIPDYIASAAETAGISLHSLALQLSDTVDSAQAAEKIYAAVEGAFVVPAIRIVAFFIVFSVCERVFAILIGIINKFFKLPVIKGINRILGCFAGALKGAVIMSVICILLSLVIMILPENEIVSEIGNSTVYQSVIETVKAVFSN